MSDSAEFDRFADNYDECLNDALSASGETKEFFARAGLSGWRSALKEVARRHAARSTMAAAPETRRCF